MLIPVEHILDRDQIDQMRQQLASGNWQDGRQSAGRLAARVKQNLQLEPGGDLSMKLGEQVRAKVSLDPLFMSAALPRQLFPPLFNCYQEGGHYGLHVDNAIMHLPNGEAMRTDLSATLFLSDPEEYEGGELCIETRFGLQEVKLPAGDLILYPSTSLHEVRPVTAGARLCAIFWLESLVRDNQDRETLFDLDQSIQALIVERGARDPEVRRLSGVYHNLVRRWAGT